MSKEYYTPQNIMFYCSEKGTFSTIGTFAFPQNFDCMLLYKCQIRQEGTMATKIDRL